MTADPAELLAGDDARRAEVWRGLTDDEREQLPPAVRAACIQSVRTLSPWVDQSVERLRREQARRANGEGHALLVSDWPPALDLEALAELEPEQPRFIIPDWLPIGYATLLAGHGGVGKSAIALHLGVCIAAGVPFFGLEVARRRGGQGPAAPEGDGSSPLAGGGARS